MTPYILLNRKKLPLESIPSPEYVYDQHQQLWIVKNSGVPLVCCMRTHASQFGETSITETREGADQTDTAVYVPGLGEADQASAHEGMDQGDLIQASRFGETSMTRAPEGSDQPQDTSHYKIHASYSHF